MTRTTPLGVVGRGVLAGAAGTAAMTVWQELSSCLQASSSSSSGRGGGEEKNPWTNAPAPANVAKRLIEGVSRRQVAADRIIVYGLAVGGGYEFLDRGR